jgi:hypothetical protein
VFKLFENNGSLGAAKAAPATNTKAIRKKRRKSFIVEILRIKLVIRQGRTR